MPVKQTECKLLYQSAWFSIESYVCHQYHEGRGREERSEAHSIAFVRAGNYVRHDASGRAIADANHVLFYRQDAPYQISHPIEGGDICTNINFHPAAVEAAGLPFDPLDPFAAGQLPVSPRQQMEQYRLVEKACANEEPDPLEMEERLLSLVSDVLLTAAEGGSHSGALPGRDDTLSSHRNLVYEARLYIAERYRARLSLDEVARAVYASPYHLSRLFKAHTGQPVYRYLSRLRLMLALNRLADPRLPLTELALEAGFSSHSQFTAAFRREFGIAPSKVRRQL